MIGSKNTISVSRFNLYHLSSSSSFAAHIILSEIIDLKGVSFAIVSVCLCVSEFQSFSEAEVKVSPFFNNNK